MATFFAVGEVKINLPQMLGQKEKSVKMLTGGIEGLFKKNKVATGMALQVAPSLLLSPVCLPC